MENLPAPSLLPAVQTMRSIVLEEFVRLAIQVLNDTIFDAVGDATNRLTEERRLLVRFDCGEAQYDILSRNLELLNQGAGRQEAEGGI